MSERMSVAPSPLHRLGIVMGPDLADLREAVGVLNPAVARGPDGQLYLLPRHVAAGNDSRIGLVRVLCDPGGTPTGVERLGGDLTPPRLIIRTLSTWCRRPAGTTRCDRVQIMGLEIIGVHLLPLFAVLMPGVCGVAITHAPGRGRSALFMGHDERRATREIDAPLAGRLGMAQITWELEDMAFKYLEPEAYWWLVEQIAEQRPRRERYVREAGELLRAELLAHGVTAEVTGRAKHLYSIYRKLLRPEINMDLQRVYDLFALRVLVDTLPACYQALGQVHALWTPVSGRFKDYIATPKPNGYQSLHTTVLGPDGRQLEVQIRTHAMHRLAEYGLAAHLFYKMAWRPTSSTRRKAWVSSCGRVAPWPRHTHVAVRVLGNWPMSQTHAVSHNWYSHSGPLRAGWSCTTAWRARAARGWS